jgi:hypothetical protein
MKTTGFVLFEYDENEEILLSFIFPEASRELKSVIQETAAVLIAANTYSLFSAYNGQFLYFEGKPNPDKSAGVRLCGICLLSPTFHPPMLSAYAQLLCQIYVDTAAPPKVLRAYLALQTDGSLEYKGEELSEDGFDADPYQRASFEVLLDRAGDHLPVIWQALVTGRSVGIYAPDVTVLQACAVPIMALAVPGARGVLPLVLESSATQTEAADRIKLPVWFSMDAAILSNRFDLAVDLASRTLRPSQAFAREAGKARLLEQLQEAIVTATSNDGSLTDVFEQFNRQILQMLGAVKARLGDLTPQNIASVNLPADTKLLLTAIATGGVFTI